MQKTCFVVCPIGQEGSIERKRSDTVLNYFIKPICKDLGFDVIRVDELNTVDNIDSTVIQYLREADLVIADMTDHNPNAFYEFGYRQALKLPLIPIIEEGEKIPFDVTTLRTISYVTNDIAKVDKIKDKLEQTIKSFDFDNLDKPEELGSTFDSSILLSIQDKLDNVMELIQKRNEEEINIIAAQVAKHAKPAVSDDTAMMQALLPQLLSNPDSFESFMQFANKYGDKN